MSRFPGNGKNSAPRRGFTAFELLLALGVFVVVLGIVSVPLAAFQGRAAMDDAAIGVVNALRRAETQALSGHFGDRWGVHFSNGEGCALPAASYHIFRGGGFVSATDTYDTFALPGSVSVTAVAVGGGCDVTFSRFHGSATTAGTITLTGANGLTRAISINGYGRVVSQ